MGKIISLTNEGDAWLIKISVTESISKYIVKKGFIALDGMSITVIDTAPTWFTITLIPHTQEVTISQHYQPGSLLNIEVDMIGKYIEKIIGAYQHVNA